MCLVRGLIFGTVDNSNAPKLSSKALQCTLGGTYFCEKPFACSSLNRFMMGIVSLRDCDKAMHSTSVVLNAICVCSLDCHMMGQPKTVIT